MFPLTEIERDRRSRGMTQAELAAAANLSVPTVRNLENGRGTLGSLAAVMAVLSLAWGWVKSDDLAAGRLVELRRAKGLSQAALADQVGCSRPCIIALEKDMSGSVSILLRVLRALGVKRVLRTKVSRTASGLVPGRNTPERDLVMTPPDLAAAVIAHFGPQMSGRILDPAKGQGAFYEQFPERFDRDWCEVTAGRNFLTHSRPADWIMTNPPWSSLRDFTRHAMTVAPNIVWLAPMVNLTTKARLRDLDAHGFGIAELVLIDTPRSWPQSGFQLVAAHLRQGHQGGWAVSRLASAVI